MSRRRLVALCSLLAGALTLGACAATTNTTASPRSDPSVLPSGSVSAAQTYQDPAGWSVTLPPGWVANHSHVTTRGGLSATGSQIANVDLPAPTLFSWAPLQAKSGVLPVTGIAVVISNDKDPSMSGPAVTPPLSMGSFMQGSYLAGMYGLDSTRVAGNGRELLITIRFGPKASTRTTRELAQLIASFRFN
jgi:hypothetical protein